MKYWKVNLLLGLAVCFALNVMSVYAGSEEMFLSGKLIYGKSNAIYSLDLSTLKEYIVYKEDDGYSMYAHLTKIDENRFLFEDKSHRLIKEFNIQTGLVKNIRSGYSPQYIAKHKKLFFYDVLPDKNTVGLFIGNLEDPIQSAELVHEGHFPMPMQVIEYSKDGIIFYHGNKLWKYGIASAALTELTVDSCTLPQLMRSTTSQLICFDTVRQHYFVRNLSEGISEYIPAVENGAAVLYIPKFDVIVFCKARLQLFPPMGEVNDIWVYNFKDDKIIRLKKNVTISLGSAIWIE